MKLALLTLTTLASISTAWKLNVWTGDGRSASFHGTQDSGCKNIAFTPALKINRAKFDPATDWYPDPGTFEFYVNKNCNGLSYRNGKGDHSLSPRVVRSYKVY